MDHNVLYPPAVHGPHIKQKVSDLQALIFPLCIFNVGPVFGVLGDRYIGVIFPILEPEDRQPAGMEDLDDPL